jgi:hypothetical protein
MSLSPIQIARYLLLLCGAVPAGWVCKSWVFNQSTLLRDTPGLTVASLDANALSHADRIQSRLMIAEALVDADASVIPLIADVFLQNGKLDRRAWSVLFSCWMKVNPREAWGFANRHTETSNSIGLPVIALEQWAEIDPQAARKILDAPDIRQYTALIRGMLKSDVSAAFHLMDEALAAGIKPEGLFQNDTNALFEEEQFMKLARIDPAYAVIWTERSKHKNLLGPVFLGWIDRNPQDARKWLDQRNDGPEILVESARYMSRMSGHYRPERMDLFMTWLPPGRTRNEIMRDALLSLAYGDPDLALKEVSRLLPDPVNRTETLGKIAGIVAMTDYAKAWDIVSLAGPADIKSQLLAGWIEVDKDHTRKLMEKLPAEDVARVAGDCIGRWVSRDPEDAVRWLARKLENQGDPVVVEQWLGGLDMHGDSLRDLVNTLPNGTVRTALAIAVADELANSDPTRALRFARESASSNDVADAVYQSWASRDPMSALEQLAADDDASETAWKNVVNETCVKLPHETVGAIETLPPGQTRDAAVLAMVHQSAFGSDPLPVTGWALSIDDADSRHSALELVFTRISLDLRAARNWEMANAMRGLIQQSEDLPETERERWLERINREFTRP